MLDRVVDAESAAVIGAYERKIDELERQKLVLAEKRARCGTAIKGYDESFRTAFEFLSNPWNLWKNGAFEDKRIVLKLTLASHLEYDWNDGVRTPEISLTFKMLQADSCREKVMAVGESLRANSLGVGVRGSAVQIEYVRRALTSKPKPGWRPSPENSATAKARQPVRASFQSW